MTTADKLARFNLYFTFVWIILAFPSLIWWKSSILWVIVISLWANIVGHFSAYIAARAELAQQRGHNLTELDRKWITELVQRPTTTSPPPATTEIISTVPKRSA